MISFFCVYMDFLWWCLFTKILLFFIFSHTTLVSKLLTCKLNKYWFHGPENLMSTWSSKWTTELKWTNSIYQYAHANKWPTDEICMSWITSLLVAFVGPNTRGPYILLISTINTKFYNNSLFSVGCQQQTLHARTCHCVTDVLLSIQWMLLAIFVCNFRAESSVTSWCVFVCVCVCFGWHHNMNQ